RVFTIESVVLFQMVEKDGAKFAIRGAGKGFLVPQEMIDFTENPGTTLGSPAHHDGIRASVIEYVAGFFGAVDIAVCDQGDVEDGTERPDGVVFGLAPIEVAPGSPVHSQGGNADILSHPGNLGRIARAGIPAGADLERDRHLVGPAGGHDAFQNFPDQGFVAHQGGSGGLLADFFYRTAHVDVDDAGAFLDVEYGRLGQHGRVRARQLHGDGIDFAIVIEAAGSLDAVPQPRVAGSHFRHGMTGSQLLAQLAIGAVGNTRHGCDKNRVGKGPGANLHARDFSSWRTVTVL